MLQLHFVTGVAAFSCKMNMSSHTWRKVTVHSVKMLKKKKEGNMYSEA